MTFTDAIRTCFRKYFTFSGRASRPEYWWFVLFLFLGGIIAAILDGMIFGTGQVTQGVTPDGDMVDVLNEGGPIAALFSLATLIPSISAGWRRMHDTGRSGLYLLYPLIVMAGLAAFGGFAGAFGGQPATSGLFGLLFILGAIIFLISPLLVLWWLTRPSQPGPNEFGPNPHGVAA